MLGSPNHHHAKAKKQAPAHGDGDTSVLSTAELVLSGSISAFGAR